MLETTTHPPVRNVGAQRRDTNGRRVREAEQLRQQLEAPAVGGNAEDEFVPVQTLVQVVLRGVVLKVQIG